ncbi:MAG: hypothetical protein DWQ34_15195 [Planctomycetota bacterium]|nr:MAG: hypothetical protein DWQ29_22095 [Planctomycetota bacterium]REJ91296.1 MAG: hypothetical protein DWQ34_15195 [Planctomycetota bacterium]REK31282.1 MAG: hypothetical protein DWQ41_00040 [Planctomycetota bacterium]REK37312.1 MAG: hypothetical protein DWQ45_07645 [Planctomycetota bacterium]
MKNACLGLCAVALLAVGVIAAEEKKDEKAVAKCPVSGKDINEEAFVEYKDAKVYFCCPGCPGAFKDNTAKYAAKANHQLVFTEQAEQKKCPLTGGKLNEDTTIDVAGVDVNFCCNNCKGKAKAKEGDEQVEFLFNDKAFEKGFEVSKDDEE